MSKLHRSRPPRPVVPSYALGARCGQLVGMPLQRCLAATGAVSQACPEHRPVDDQMLAAAALWFGAGRRALPMEVPDVPPLSLADVAHRAGRVREDTDPEALVRRWFEIAATAGPTDLAPGLWSGSAA